MLPQNRSNMLVALGSNEKHEQVSPASALQIAVTKLCEAGAVIRNRSAMYRTPAHPVGSGPDFANAVIEIEAQWNAREAITRLHEVEAEMGRRRRHRWEQRHIDLDLLAIGEDIRPDLATARSWINLPADQQQQRAPEQLVLPHPRMQDRAFVLVPLADVAPDWMHPVLRRTATDLRDSLPPAEREAVTPIENGWD
ncbi:MAG: 2-amino-4-hydroxy-6-hydroxymethyldihydropteridine diphosphokinase [Pseudomonadota bacterium]